MSIIWSVVFFYIVYRLVKNRQNSGSGRSGPGGPPVVHTTPAQHRERRNKPVIQQTNRPANNRNGQAAVSPNQAAGRQPEEREISTMEYLEEKARQDAAEHAREKWEENRRLHQNYGGLSVAERLFDGDTVPGGKKCVVCKYCGAENLVPMMSREHYGCYFCREPLQ